MPQGSDVIQMVKYDSLVEKESSSALVKLQD